MTLSWCGKGVRSRLRYFQDPTQLGQAAHKVGKRLNAPQCETGLAGTKQELQPAVMASNTSQAKALSILHRARVAEYASWSLIVACKPAARCARSRWRRCRRS